MTTEELFEQKQHLVFFAIKDQFGSYETARIIAERNNMEMEDLIQVARLTLWELCLKYDSEKDTGFKTYALTHMKWRMSDEIHEKGTAFKVTRWTKPEERNKINTRPIDLHANGEVVEGFFAVSTIDVEKEAIVSVEFQQALDLLTDEERLILIRKSQGYTDSEISNEIGKTRQIIHKKKKRAFLKINPDYKSVIQKKNHLLQQVI